MSRYAADSRGVVAGVFEDQKAAARALAALVEEHFEPEDDISVVLTDEWTLEREDVPIRDELEIIEGAEIGGGAGAVIGAVGGGMVAAGLVGGPAALVAVGPVIAALEGALAVGAVGAVAGWLVGLGVVKEEADFHAGRIEEGAVWVGVHATGERAETARSILKDAGAEFFEHDEDSPTGA
ncbi:MAG: hypothetical protein U5R14_11465 [Gemmatimonadota bacterium]|nr:hypothetical protein [Gemmatimonadota bacterium]